jgi:hypothetical protein
MNQELQTPRGRFFFWIGLGILPVFWLPWMKPRDFSPRQIQGAKIWTLLFLMLVFIAWNTLPLFRNGVLALPMTYSHVSLIIGLALLVWLFFRLLTVIELIVIPLSMGGQMASLFMPTVKQLEPHPASLLFIAVPALLHLWPSLQQLRTQ